VSVRPSVSGFRPNIPFSARRAGLVAATATAASAILVAAPAANAATTNHSTHNVAVTGPAKAKAKAQVKAKTKTKAQVKAKAKAAAQQDYTFYDSTTPSQIPENQQIATYADGDYAVVRSTVSNPEQVIWIDIDGHDANANALDVEPGDAAPSEVAIWVKHRLTAHPGSIAIVYTMRSEWAAAKASVATLPASMRSQVKWWIADPTGHPHILPGAQATQWYWGDNYDISSAEPGF
jgi:hypothetical protein